MNERDPILPAAWLYEDDSNSLAMSDYSLERRAKYDPDIKKEYSQPLYLAERLARIADRWSDPRFVEKELEVKLSDRERTIVFRLARTIATHIESGGTDWKVVE